MHVTLDTDKIQGVNLAELDVDQLKELMLSQTDEVEDIQGKVDTLLDSAHASQAESDMAYDLRALGGSSKIGPLEFDNVLGNLVLLNMVDSPFMSGDLGEEVSFEDVTKALYILFHGQDAVGPIMAIADRISDLYTLKDMCTDNPVMCDKVIAKVEEISKARIRFAKSSMEFYDEHFTREGLQAVCDDLMRVLIEATKAFDEVDRSGTAGAASPKKS